MTEQRTLSLHTALHSCLYLGSSSHLFQTVWADFSMERPSPTGEGTPKCAVTLGVVLQGTEHRIVRQLQEGRRNTKSAQVRPWGSTASTTMWSLASAVGGLQCCGGSAVLQGLLWSSVVPPAMDQGRQQSLLELVVYTHAHPAVKIGCRGLCSDRVGCRHSWSWAGDRTGLPATIKYIGVFLTLWICVIQFIIWFNSGVVRANRKGKSIRFGKIILNTEARRISAHSHLFHLTRDKAEALRGT